MTQIKDGEEAIGNHVKVKVVKNKVAPPFRAAEFDIILAKAFQKMEKSLIWVPNWVLYRKSGSWLQL